MARKHQPQQQQQQSQQQSQQQWKQQQQVSSTECPTSDAMDTSAEYIVVTSASNNYSYHMFARKFTIAKMTMW